MITGSTPKLADVQIGARIRMLRNTAGMSQETLAAKVGVTFQQIQKYEKGTNRVSGSRLIEIAKVFGVKPADLFANVPDANQEGTDAKSAEDLVYTSSREAIRLNAGFRKLSDAHRSLVLNLIDGLVKGGDA